MEFFTERERSVDYTKLIAVLIIIGLAYFFLGYSKPMTWDEASHSSAAIFFGDAARFSLTQGISLDYILPYSANYHMHYKVFNTVASYTPLFYIFNVPFILVFGEWVVKAKIVAILEALITLFFVFKLARLYDGRRWFPWAAMLLLAVQPVFVDIATRNYVDIGLAMFIVMSFYTFSKYLRDHKPRYLYYTGILLGMSFLAKPMLPVILLVFLIVLIWDGKLVLLREHSWKFVKGIILMLIFMSPFLIEAGMISTMGQDRFVNKWTNMGMKTGRIFPDFSEIGPLILAHRSHIDLHRYSTGEWKGQVTDYMQLTKNLSAIWFQWYLIPFFIIGFIGAFRKQSWEIEKMSVLLIIFVLYIFTVTNHVSTLKHLVIILPLVTLLSVRGLYNFFYWKRLSELKKYLIPVVIAFVIISSIQAFHYWASISEYDTTADLERVARFVLADSKGMELEDFTVLTTFAPHQILEFQLLDKDRRVFVNYIPRTVEELEKAIQGDLSFAESELWERYNIEYPKPSYVIIHERRLEELRFKYNLDYFLSKDNIFEKLKVIDGRLSGDKTYIFRVNK